MVPSDNPSDPENPKTTGGNSRQTGGAAEETPQAEPVWTYRGYKLRPSEFTTAMVHLFRAEVQRANVWRQRLDATTNWAVVATGAVLSFAFTQAESNPIVIPLNMALVTLFLMVEARRYRYYELWSYRVRLMETDFFASMLVPPFHPSPEWSEALAEHLLHPYFPISTWEALGRRLRRNYIWIYAIVGLAWIAKLSLYPDPTGSLDLIIRRASVGPLPGEWVLAGVAIFYLILITISLATIGLHDTPGEVIPRYGGLVSAITSGMNAFDKGNLKARAWFRPAARRQQLLTFIVTDQVEKVTNQIFKVMNRGVTSLAGTGMYTGQAHGVLMVALTVTEVPQLKALVAGEDPKAFVIVTPAREVFGRGFMPLEGDENA